MLSFFVCLEDVKIFLKMLLTECLIKILSEYVNSKSQLWILSECTALLLFLFPFINDIKLFWNIIKMLTNYAIKLFKIRKS